MNAVEELAEFLRKYPWIQTMPQQVQNFFLDAEYGFENADNFRMAALTDQKALADFQTRHDKGCCGDKEEIIEDENGKLWVVGFNYGH